jgi:hypothetical protein
MMVARAWRKHGLQPHRIERYMASHDGSGDFSLLSLWHFFCIWSQWRRRSQGFACIHFCRTNSMTSLFKSSSRSAGARISD